jgi:hypothetical protein
MLRAPRVRRQGTTGCRRRPPLHIHLIARARQTFSYVVFADRIKGLGGPTGAGIFLDASTNVIGTGALSATPPDPSLFDERRQVFVNRIGDRTILEGELLSLTRRVPSPSSLALAPGLFWWTRRTRR